MLNILSLGAGVQSSTMALMAAHGEITPMPDCAIFADTQHEPKAVIDWLDWLETKLPFPVYRVSNGDLWKAAIKVKRTKDGLRTYIQVGIPAFMTEEGEKAGIGMRVCTAEFKIKVINQQMRKLLGFKRISKKQGILANVWIGISTDEADRMKPNRNTWALSKWPLIQIGMSRADCYAWMEKHGYQEPPRSACTFCPYKDDNSWLALTPEEFADAVKKEKELQEAYASTTELRSIPFFHSDRVPLEQVKFKPGRLNAKRDQLNLFRNECEGMCGV